MALGVVSKPMIGLLSLLQLIGAGAVIGITGIHMANIDIRSFDSIVHQKVCLLTEGDNTSICMYAYALGAVSIILTFAIGLLQICTCNVCGCGAVMDTVFAVMAAGWWVVGAFVISTNATKATGAGRPAREWREAVAWLTWICAGLFAALFLVHLSRVISKHCNCCRRRRGGDDVEKSILGTSRPRSAALELGKEVRGRHYLSGNAGQAPLSQQFRGDARNI